MRVRIPRQRTDIEHLDRPVPASLSTPAPRILRAPRPRPAAETAETTEASEASETAETFETRDPLAAYRVLVARTLIRHHRADPTTCGCGAAEPCPTRAHAARLLEWV